MDVCKKLEDYFERNKRAISTTQLLSRLNMTQAEKNTLELALYQLQLKGQIYLDEYGNYLHVPKDCCLKSGMVSISNKGNYYIKVDGTNIHLKNGKEKLVQKGDYVFVELIVKDDEKKHFKYREGMVKSVVKPPQEETQKYFMKGYVHITSNQSYFLKNNDEMIEIDSKEIGSAYDGDLVTAEIQVTGKKKKAYIKQVLERKQEVRLYEYCFYRGKLQWVPVATNYYPVQLLDKGEFGEHDCVFAKIVKEEEGIVYLEKVKEIERFCNPKVVAEEVIQNHGFLADFSQNALREVESLENNKEMDNRVDYTNLVTVTIDGESAKDFDDAISIEKIENGNYILYVHIADVSYFVKSGMNLQQEAYKRGTSVYLGNHVFPMFPSQLSNGLCSLNPGELKFTKTCKMEIDRTGKVVDFLIVNSMIRSNKRMTYQAVDEVLEQGRIPDGYEDFVSELMLMKELNSILQIKKIKRGYTLFCHDEKDFVFDEYGYPKNVNVQTNSLAREIIENFMLSANEVIASYLHFMEVPTLYRNHEAPKKYHLEKVIKILKETGYWNNQIDMNDPFLVAKLLKRYRNKKEYLYLSRILLKSMSRAYYDSKCGGHYGLGLFYYTHFTSPIRRYPDFLVHETLNRVWNGEVFLNEEYEQLSLKGSYLSEREVAATEAEIEYDRYLLSLYAEQFRKKELQAEIVFLDKENLYLSTTQYLEGVLGHNGEYDRKHKQVLINGKSYHIGDKITVVLDENTNEEGQYIFQFSKSEGKRLIKKKIGK